MKESTTWYIMFGVFFAVIVSGLAFRKHEGSVFLKDCEEVQVVKSVDACVKTRPHLTCTVETEKHSFRTDVAAWPGSIIIPGDEIYQCGTATRLRDIPRKANCKNGSCDQLEKM